MSQNEKRPEQAVREKLESIRARMYLRFGEKGTKRLLWGSLIAAIAVVLLIVLIFSLKIKEIEVTGDVTMFNESDVISAAELSIGDSWLLRTSGNIERTVKANLPLAKKVDVSKSLGGKIRIYVEFDTVEYYCRIGEYYYALDEELRVLDSDKSKSKYSSYGAILLKLPETREPVVGKTLVFYDTIAETDTEKETLYEVRDDGYYSYISSFLKSLADSGYKSDTDGIIFEEKFDVRLIYANKFLVRFGSVKDLEIKFRILFGILDEGSLQYADKVSVDLTTPSKPTARADGNLDFTEFTD